MSGIEFMTTDDVERTVGGAPAATGVVVRHQPAGERGRWINNRAIVIEAAMAGDERGVASPHAA